MSESASSRASVFVELAGDQAPMTGRLPQSQERFERSEHASALFERLDDAAFRRCQDRVVDVAFGRVQLDGEGRVGTWR